MNFKSLPQLLDHFKEESTCIAYYEQLRWNGKPVCPHCGTDTIPYKTNRGYKCSDKDCAKKFTVKVGTIFENSKIHFRIWFGAIFLATNHKKGISSLQLASDLNITQKTAWFVLHRIREMLKESAPAMLGGNGGMVEADETYIGGKTINKHESKIVRNENGVALDVKQVVLGVIERNGKVVLKHINSASSDNMVPFIQKTVQSGSRIITDESRVYTTLHHSYTHNKVNHTLKVYVDGDSHTNTIENFWSVLKRGLNGTYHSVSEKHLERYLNEFANRFNERKATSQERFEKFLNQSDRRLSYKKLIA
ncbi:MAG: IS1595 family transposase [Chryseolinea sp.]